MSAFLQPVAQQHGAQVIRVEQRQISATRNAWARRARGDTLFFVDADIGEYPNSANARQVSRIVVNLVSFRGLSENHRIVKLGHEKAAGGVDKHGEEWGGGRDVWRR
jgi:glycosyltransferase involved in cell wall biosynthesis